MSHHSSRHRPRTVAAVATAVAILATVAVGAASAQAQEPVDVAGPSAPDVAAAEPGTQTVTVTLVTGDVVTARVDRARSVITASLDSAGGEIDHNAAVWQDGTSTYVIPDGVQPLIDAGVVDAELFNITTLIASGYDDATTTAMPVIVSYDGGRMPRSELGGAEVTATLESVDSVGLAVDKDSAADTWESLVPDPDSRASGRPTRIWLDRIVRKTTAPTQAASPTADLGTSTVPLTGAPDAHGRGYDGAGVTVAVLDTGVDAGHPDLQDRIAGSRSFVFGDSIDDLDGHGTHTASTVAGTGAASDGRYAGMAPGADLLIGKVLDDNGSGTTSAIIDGMEWAVAQGADIVSMSLGASGGSACSGPDVEAIETLSEQALFVIAAGNSSLNGSISTPGCAPSALTVGAVDREGRTAEFSSRGPVVDGVSVKPDLASQGVGVVAAAAGGRGDHAYVAQSGTSMATPHVAGGAALVLQARPDLEPRALKSILTSAAAPTRSPVMEQGAGQLDVSRALDQAVYGSTDGLLGTIAYPASEQAPIVAAVTLTNTSDAAVELDLKVIDVVGGDGESPVRGLLTLPQRTIVVPAQGTADVPVRIDPSARIPDNALGTVTGRLEARALPSSGPRNRPGHHVIVPFGVHVEVPSADLTVVGIDRHGDPADDPSTFQLFDDARDTAARYTIGYPDPGSTTIRVPLGTYSISGVVMTRDEPGNVGTVASVTQLLKPTVKVSGDTTVVLDARNARQITWKTDQPTEAKGFAMVLAMGMDDAGQRRAGHATIIPSATRAIYAQQVHGDRRFAFAATARLVAPVLTMTSSGGYVVDDLGLPTAAEFHGTGSAGLVYIGKGSQTNFEAHDIDGKVVLLDASNPGGGNASNWAGYAAAGGAVGVLAAVEGTVGRFQLSGGYSTVPMASITGPDSQALQAELADGPVTMSWEGTAMAKTPYVYTVAQVADDGVVAGQDVVHDHTLARVDDRFHTQGVDDTYWSDAYITVPGMAAIYAGGTPLPVDAPAERTEFFTPSDTVRWTSTLRRAPNGSTFGTAFDGPFRAAPRSQRTADWFKTPYAPTRNTFDLDLLTREANRLTTGIAPTGDAGGHDMTIDFRDGTVRQLLVNGESATPVAGRWVLPQEPAELTFRQEWTRPVSPENSVGVGYAATWTWTSGPDTQGAQPILVPRVDLPSDLRNQVTAGEPIRIGLGAVSDRADGPVDLAEVSVEYAHGTEVVPAQLTQWDEAEVRSTSDGWVAEIPAGIPAGSFLHLRVVMSDHDGSRVEEVIVRAAEVS